MNFKPVLLALIAILSITACTQDENIIGGSISPPKDRINISYVDSVPISAYSFVPKEFLLRTDGNIAGHQYAVLGGLKPDIPQAAGIKGDMAMEFWYDELSIEPSDTTKQLVLDSVILVLIQNGYYGDTAALHYFEAFELNQSLSNTQNYYSDENPFDYYSESDKIGERQIQTIDRTVNDSIRESSGYIHNIAIPLDKSVGERIMDNLDEIATDVDKFREMFKGIYVKTTFSTKAMLSIYPYLTSSAGSSRFTDFSSMNLIYHYNYWDTLVIDNETLTDLDNDSIIGFLEEDTVQYFVQSLVVNNECQWFNVIRKDYGDYDFSYDETTVQPELLYVQGLDVAKVRLSFPKMYDLPAFKPLEGEDSARIAINSAKLTLTVDRGVQDLNQYMAPFQLLLRRDTLGRDTIGNVTYTPGESVYLSQNQEYPYGYRNSEYKYVFNIAEYVQELINTKQENPDDFILSVSGNRNNPGFAFLKGLTSTDENLKLEIVYTRY